jgi:hypothetical protein
MAKTPAKTKTSRRSAKKPKSDPFVLPAAKDVASLFQVMPGTFDSWRSAGCPGKVPNGWDLRQICPWVARQRASRKSAASTGRDQFELEKAAVMRLKRQQLEGELVPVEALRADLSAMVNCLRRFGEQAFTKWGPECLQSYNESLDDMARVVLGMSPRTERQRSVGTVDIGQF